jgi:DNA modification methylase
MANNWIKIIIGDSRSMKEIKEETVDFIVTSPPYWHIKDYGIPGQIGYGQSLHEYLKQLYYVWQECYRVIRKGGRFCLNIGDQFARSVIYGRYKIIPIHAEFIAQCEQIGFDFMGSIIWQKKTTMNTTGGANVMGSYPYPTNGMVEVDYEYIHIFKKMGPAKKVPKEIKEASKLTKEEWKEYFSGHWYFGGAKQIEHEAMFPEELPKRLIKMFTFVGDTVLDPFVGSGTTIKAAINLSRNVIGYEINKEFLEVIKEKIGMKDSLLKFYYDLQIIERKKEVLKFQKNDYKPRIQDAKPNIDPQKFRFNGNRLYKVVDVVNENAIKLDTGLIAQFLGVKINRKDDMIHYLRDYIVGKDVFLEFDNDKVIDKSAVNAYIYLKNKIFINSYLIKSGLGSPDYSIEHKFKNKFIQLCKER